MNSEELSTGASGNQFIPGPLHSIDLYRELPYLQIKRLDLIQSWATGNKYYKLKYLLTSAWDSGVTTVVSKGGMFSNHLYALANACTVLNLKCICIVRAHLSDENNPTIKFLRAQNAQLIFVPPDQYKLYDECQADNDFPGSMFIPEGGEHSNAINGSTEIWSEIKHKQPDHVIISGGTLTTALGFLKATHHNSNIIIIPAWKGCTKKYITDKLATFNIQPKCKWELWPDEHCGGFGKSTEELTLFMYRFTSETLIPLDPVYTGKMMFAIDKKIRSNYFGSNDNVIAIHTGGLQGIAGFNYRFPQIWNEYYSLVDVIANSKMH